MEDRIHYLFRKYLNNTCNKAELEELFDLIEQAEPQSPLREKLIETLLEKNPPDSRDIKSPNRLKIVREPAVETTKNRRFTLGRFSVAAAVAGLVFGMAGWYYLQNRPANGAAPIAKSASPAVSKTTARSEYKYLLLPDSSQVWLNAESKLDFPASFGTNDRHVVLTGEAYFDVKHADKQPFIIHTAGVTTTVLGTAFNIKAYPGGEKIIVTVKRGKVKVDYGQKQLAVLVRGQEISIDTTQNLVHEKKLTARETETWHEGNLSYDDFALADVLSDLQRVYDARIRVGDPAIKRLRISTSFRREQGIEQALEILCRLTDKKLIKNNGEYILQ
ncbi:MAG TPA: FecR domain-containing protein [Flavihumibacter sp.]|nr:FecR domain-containing protein [Flavihumibacter sp.]